MFRFRHQPIPGKGMPHKDVLAGRLQESRRAHDHLRRALRSEITASKQPFSVPRPIPAQRVPVILYLEGLFAILLCFVHTSVASLISTSPMNPLVFQVPLPALVLLLGYRLSRRASETGVVFYQKRYFTNILFPSMWHYLLPLAVVYVIYLVVLIENGLFAGNALTSLFDLLYGRWANSSYFGLLAILLVAIFPILLEMRHRNTRRYPVWLLHVFLFSLLYEVLMNTLENTRFEGDIAALYRILPFRFVFVFALGMYIYQRRKRSKKPVYYVLSFIIGLSYLLFMYFFLLAHNGRMPDFIPLFHGYPFNSMVAAFYIFPPLAWIIYRAQTAALPPLWHRLFSLLGKSSYPIICVGFLLFSCKSALQFSFTPFIWIDTALSMLVCIAGGILLYTLSKVPFVRKLRPAFYRAMRFVLLVIQTAFRKTLILWCNLRIRMIDRRLYRLQKP